MKKKSQSDNLTFATLLIKVSKMDAVVIVALITGAVSITGVIISSVVSKIIDYKKNRQEYLAQKREVPYMQFIEMYYRIIESSKESENNYVQNEMVKDISKFNQQLTLWGSRDVVKKWIKFRANGQKKTLAKRQSTSSRKYSMLCARILELKE